MIYLIYLEKMLRLLIAFVFVYAVAVDGFSPLSSGASAGWTRRVSVEMKSGGGMKVMGALLVSGGLFVAPVVPMPILGGSLIPVVHAEFRAAQKRSYFRYAPKLKEGGLFFGSDLKKAIGGNDWKVVEKMYEEFATKIDGSDKKTVTQTDTYVNSRFFRPMLILSGTFAERGTSPKQRALQEQLDLFTAAMGELENCIRDMPGDSFFSGKKKMPTGAERTKKAKAAYDAGKKAYNEYVTIFNEGLMLELTKLDKIA